MIRNVKHVNIPVKDQARALAFYTEKLGFEVATDVSFGPRRWIELSIPGGQTRVTLFTPDGHEGRVGTFSGLVFATDDVEATHAEMAAQGVKFTQPPKREAWGTSALFEDADGNGFVLSSTGD